VPEETRPGRLRTDRPPRNLNPAVTFGFLATHRFEDHRVAPYNVLTLPIIFVMLNNSR